MVNVMLKCFGIMIQHFKTTDDVTVNIL